MDLPLNCSFLRSIKLNYSQSASIDEREKIEILAEPQKLVEIDFRTVDAAPNLSNLSASWKIDNLSQANAIAVFNNSTFTDELVMNSFHSQSWGTTIYEFQPFEMNSGELRFNLTMDGAKSIWAVHEIASNKLQNYSPTFAPARIKMAQQMTPHRKVRVPKLLDQKIKK